MSFACDQEQAERLGRAVRFRTVTITSESAREDPRYAEFSSFLSFLMEAFPRAAAGLTWEKLGDLAFLLSWGPPAGTTSRPPILFYSHYDVVPAGNESAWTHPPFGGVVAEGHVWGRGTLDDKGVLMALMETVESLLKAGFCPDRTLYLAFGGDEETLGERGAGTITRALADRRVRLGCLFDEGSAITQGIVPFVSRPVATIGLAEKGFASIEVTVTGTQGHSSMPGRGTAAGALSVVMAAIERNRFPARLTPLVARFFSAVAPHAGGAVGIALRLLRLLWPFLRGALTANPSVDALLRTTQAVTILQSGQVPNVIPADARAVVNLRLLPGDGTAGALARVERVARAALPAGFSVRVRFVPGDALSEPVAEARVEPALWKAVEKSIRLVQPDAVIAPFLVLGATDSRKFAARSEAIVRFMPVTLTSEDLARIHGVDERISLENYGRMIAFYQNLIRAAAGGNA